jgi:hypothetical protein
VSSAELTEWAAFHQFEAEQRKAQQQAGQQIGG